MARCVDCKYQGDWERKFEDSHISILPDGTEEKGELYMKCQAPSPPTTELISRSEAWQDMPCESFISK